MIELIRTGVLALTGAAAFCAVATELTPKGPVKSVVRTVCAVSLAAALLSPLLEFDFPAYALNLARYRDGAAALTESGKETGRELNRRVIEERLAAYILDKARSLGASATVTEARVTLKWDADGLWYPTAVEIVGNYSASLSDCIAAELGVPAEAQTWRNDGEKP